MTKTLAWTIFLSLTAILLSASICQPHLLSDEGNAFFRQFVTHEMLGVIGVIVTITLASSASIHLELNKLEERTGNPFQKARNAIRDSSVALVSAFGLAFLLVMVKPWIGGSDHLSAALNSASILIFLFSLAIMADLTMAIFRIPAIRTDKGAK